MGVSQPCKRLAMWSGPRNLSTAMMYAFAQRDDCEIWDEPFYAAYLAATGLDHPLGKEIIAAGHTDANEVIELCKKTGPSNQPVFYQKHMTQHMIPSINRDWILGLTNVFLIRDPARVLASYAAKRENPTLDDIGFRQQAELIDLIVSETGQTPPIIDSTDIRSDPENMLRHICDHVEIDFQLAMLQWPSGGNAQDGVWAPHWYHAVWNSTGFAGPENPRPEVPAQLADTYRDAQKIYDRIVEMKQPLGQS